ncbi:hypothetical protein [Leifsonia sp. A12D58]|uniref:hypothetical protein n=1 Tax=Leifsonia sp. A12D58 TaxID=3397674 RepID=UPI0039E0F997
MDAEDRQRYLQQLSHLRTLLDARNRIKEVAQIVVDSPSDDEAAANVQHLLHCSDTAARHVISTPLRMYRRGEELALEITELELALEQP